MLLSRLKALDKKIRVAIIGIGSVGKGLFYQCHITPGIECVAVADIKLERATACAEWLGREYRITRNLAEVHDAIQHGLIAVCEDGNLLAQCDLVNVLIESSNAIAAAGQFALTALEHRKHLVMMNAEADLIFGPFLMQRARENGVVYTSCDGDQPAVMKRLIDDLQLWGFDLVMAGNIKGFLDRDANPTTIIPEADKRMLDYRMCASYTDGTKLNIEMALVANALGLSVATPGMSGPRANHVRDVLHLFDLDALWQDHRAVVDYVLGCEPKGGVFAVGYCDNAYQRSMLDWFPPEMGDGPFYVFYRPYHLCHIEAMTTVAMAFLDGQALLQPSYGFQTNVYAYAKRDLRRGDKLDGIGGYACYSLIENCAANESDPGLPICLAEDVTLKRDVAKNEKIFLRDVVYDPARFDFRMFDRAAKCSKARL